MSQSCERDLARQRRFAAVLDALFPLSAHLGDLLTDDTVLCRCEEITVSQVRQAVAEGATTVSAVRMLTRAGMGRCQGRMCGASVAELLARELDQPVEAVGQATPRPPVVPIPLAWLARRRGGVMAGQSWDVVVVGGGLIGSAAAYHLAKSGVRTLLLEQGDLASGASGANFGNVQVQDAEFGLSLELSLQGYELRCQPGSRTGL